MEFTIRTVLFIVYYTVSCCSKDCSHWKLLNPATDDVRFKALVVKGMLLGDPSSERDNKYGQSAGFVLSERKKDTPTSEPSNVKT